VKADLAGLCLWDGGPVLRQTSYQASASTMATLRAAEGIVAAEHGFAAGAIVMHSRPWPRCGSADLCSGGWPRANLLVHGRGPRGTNLVEFSCVGVRFHIEMHAVTSRSVDQVGCW
jgi:hypothetical protein